MRQLAKTTFRKGLVAYYPFDGRSTDYSGYGNNGADTSITYGPTYGKFWQGAGFASASSSKIVVADNSAWKQTGPFTLICFIKFTATANDGFWQSYSRNTAYAGWRLEINNGFVAFESGKNTGTTLATDYQKVSTAVGTYKDGFWHMVGAVYDGVKLLIYIDGKLSNSVAWANAPVYAATNYCRFGCYNGTGTDVALYDGSIDHPTIFSFAFTAKDMADYYRFSQLGPIRQQFYIAAGTLFTQALSDSFSLSELFTKQPGKTFSETFFLSEAFATLLTAFRTFTDSITLSEVFAAVKTKVTAYSDSITLSEAIIKLPGKVLTDSVSLVEFYAKRAYKAISDALTLSEAFTAVKTKVQTLIDSLSLSEFFSKLTGKQATDSLTITENFTKTAQRTFTEAQITLTEAYSSVKTRVQSFVETFSLYDTIIKVKNAVKSLTDSISITESFATLKSFVRTLTDSITLSEAFTTIKSKLQSLTDSLTLAETFTTVKNAVKSLTDTLSLTEVFSAVKTAFRTFTEAFSLSEAFNATKTAYRTFTESFSLTDTLMKLTSKAFAEVISISETIAKYKNGVLVFWQARIKGTLAFVKRIKPTFTWGTRTKPSNSFWTKRNRP